MTKEGKIVLFDYQIMYARITKTINMFGSINIDSLKEGKPALTLTVSDHFLSTHYTQIQLLIYLVLNY